MIYLSDTGLGYLVLAAARVPPSHRAAWLRRIAERIEPPSPATLRKRRARALARNGHSTFRIVGHHDRLVTALLESRRLDEQQASRRELVERALGEVLSEWADRWLSK